ncbi:MAG: hypothetical protein IJ282_00495 [Lachnospiraceae bacterium]|nr:hypothetical protein [Lachnospiraceae bacterium]
MITQGGDIIYEIKINRTQELLSYNLDGKWNDYIAVQKNIIRTMKQEKFFEKYSSVRNLQSGIDIRITTKGIKETFGPGLRYKYLPRELKELKVAVVRSLPLLIKMGHLLTDNVENFHGKKETFGYIVAPVIVDEKKYNVRICIKKTIGTNYFWIHHVDEIEKSSGLLSPSQETDIIETQNFDLKLPYHSEEVKTDLNKHLCENTKNDKE